MARRYLLDLDLGEDVEFIVDTKKGINLDMFEVWVLLNEQDKKIKELEKKLKTSYRKGLLQKQFDKDVEIEQLQQSQNQKAIEVLEKMRNRITNNSVYCLTFGSVICKYNFINYIDNQISELKGDKKCLKK